MNLCFGRIFRFGRSWAAGAVVVAALSLNELDAQTNSTRHGPPPAPRRPSIILILADNVGYGDLSCYGQAITKTPNLDKLASEGIRFTSYYAGSPEDGPSRAALLTGVEPRHSHPAFNEPMAQEADSIATLLKGQGFQTCLIGEWGLGDTAPSMPDRKGFDEFAGYLSQGHAQDYYTDRLWRQDPRTGFNDQESIFDNMDGKRGKYIPDLLTSAGGNFININQPDKFNHYRPFFLCVSYPIAYPTSDPVPGSDAYANESQAARTRAALIARMDDGIGQLMAKLAQLKIETNTAIFFTSVGGPPDSKKNDGATAALRSGGELRGPQGSLYEGGIRVPMIVRWPARIQPGQVSNLPCAAWDFLATAAEMAFTKPPEKTDGISLLPTLTGKAQKKRHEILSWQSGENGSSQAVRWENWKAIRTESSKPWELYDLKNDPGEQKNAADKNSGVLAKIQKLLSAP